MVAVFVYIAMARKPIYNRLGVLKKNHNLKNAHYAFVRSDPKWKGFPWKLYKEMCEEFMEEMLLEILEGNRAHFWGIGTMRLIKKKPRQHPTKGFKPRVNYNQTKIQGFTVYHNNRSTDGYWVQMRWHKWQGKTKGLGFYRFDWSKRKLKPLVVEIMNTPGGHNRYQKVSRK